jgi:hypothetical protein
LQEQGNYRRVDEEPNDWGFEYDFNLLLETALNWYSSGSPTPPTKEDMLLRDPLWDSNVRRVRHLLQFQLDGIESDS